MAAIHVHTFIFCFSRPIRVTATERHIDICYNVLYLPEVSKSRASKIIKMDFSCFSGLHCHFRHADYSLKKLVKFILITALQVIFLPFCSSTTLPSPGNHTSRLPARGTRRGQHELQLQPQPLTTSMIWIKLRVKTTVRGCESLATGRSILL